MILHFPAVDIYFSNLALVFNIYIKFTHAVRYSSFWFTANRNSCHYFCRNRINQAEITAAAVTGDDEFGKLIVHNGVWILPGIDLSQHLVSLQIKNGDIVYA